MTAGDPAERSQTDGPSCSLASDALRERIGAWQSLTAQALTRQEGQGWVRTTYPNTPPVARGLAELIAAEQECCAFLEFQVHERNDVLEVELRYPPELASALELTTAFDWSG